MTITLEAAHLSGTGRLVGVRLLNRSGGQIDATDASETVDITLTSTPTRFKSLLSDITAVQESGSISGIGPVVVTDGTLLLHSSSKVSNSPLVTFNEGDTFVLPFVFGETYDEQGRETTSSAVSNTPESPLSVKDETNSLSVQNTLSGDILAELKIHTLHLESISGEYFKRNDINE